jgi:hypothetical protein
VLVRVALTPVHLEPLGHLIAVTATGVAAYLAALLLAEPRVGVEVKNILQTLRAPTGA